MTEIGEPVKIPDFLKGGDYVRVGMVTGVDACLAHIRAVAFGEASASYKINDLSGRPLHVLIKVECYEGAPKGATAISSTTPKPDDKRMMTPFAVLRSWVDRFHEFMARYLVFKHAQW